MMLKTALSVSVELQKCWFHNLFMQPYHSTWEWLSYFLTCHYGILSLCYPAWAPSPTKILFCIPPWHVSCPSIYLAQLTSIYWRFDVEGILILLRIKKIYLYVCLSDCKICRNTIILCNFIVPMYECIRTYFKNKKLLTNSGTDMIVEIHWRSNSTQAVDYETSLLIITLSYIVYI